MNSRHMLLGMSLLPLFACGQADPSADEVGQLGTPITLSQQVYELRSADSGLCIAVAGASQQSGAAALQSTCDGTASQQWALRLLPDNSYELKAQHSGLCLAIASDSPSRGVAAVQQSCASTPNQSWLPVDASGAVLLKPQTTGSNGRRCLDVSGGSIANLAPLEQGSCRTQVGQRWVLTPVGSSGTGGTGGTGTGTGGTGTGGTGGTGTGGTGGTGTGTGGTGTPVAGTTTVSYTVDNTTIFANPERGFYHHHETTGGSPLSTSQLSGYRSGEAVSLILRLYYLDSFRSGNISASYLAGISSDFASIRAAGLKTVLRFAYTSSMTAPYGDASKATILAQLAQLKPILQANADIIATLQVGFIGAWGEWFYTDFFGDQGSISGAQWSDRQAVVDALLAILPPSRSVQLRTPAFKQHMYGAAALTAGEAFSGSARSRIGHHNDCFLASPDDWGTYGNVTADKAYLASENLYVPQGGETCATSAYSGWSNASADMERLRYSFLNRDYLAAVYSSWGSNLDIAQRRLGYRLALTDGTFDNSSRPGGELKLSLGLRNDGYAAPYNPRGVEIIARNIATGARLSAKLPVDPRQFAPGSTARIDSRLCVPPATAEGSYALSLALPDPEPALHGRPEYAIRLANSGTWDSGTGENSLKQTVTIAASATAAACAAGSTPLSPL